jgi:hypothetical protein
VCVRVFFFNCYGEKKCKPLHYLILPITKTHYFRQEQIMFWHTLTWPKKLVLCPIIVLDFNEMLKSLDVVLVQLTPI